MEQQILQWMEHEGYRQLQTGSISSVFISSDQRRIVIIDTGICEDTSLSYDDYTREQNHLMYSYGSLYRFVVDDNEDLDFAKDEYRLLTAAELGAEADGQSARHGADRAVSAVSPTPVEYRFEEAFLDVYGHESYNKILREASFPDVHGVERYYDYLVEVREPHYYIAIEQNGVQYHHPAIVGKRQYRSQLTKQNSFIAYGNKLYRWSIGGMVDKDNFAEDIQRYLGEVRNFLTVNYVKASRSFELYTHQKNLLEEISDARRRGRESFLVVLPTGTGKTAILIEDLRSIYAEDPCTRTLIMEPTRALCDQVHHAILESGLPEGLIDIHTNAWMVRNYHTIDSAWYDYIAVDEAHHAVAPSLKRVIQHFTPRTLLGMTATDKRLDTRNLETVFGEYDTHLTLKEAILKGILVPIHAFRIKSNLDLSMIRYNGKDYVHADLQRHVIIDSRDQLIADVLKTYFSSEHMRKQGVVFCVSVRHAESLAERLRDCGLTARAVSGKDRSSLQYLKEYEQGKIQFLTTCSLIHEGWDSPQTSVIVMARPTMSKVLYTQQLGRGTRRCEGKEALYVIDVVDNYGANRSPWTIHALTRMSLYRPWANIFFGEQDTYSPTNEELVLSGFYEEERKIEQIDIFTFEERYADYLSTEQLARELFVSTGSVKSWLKKGQIAPDVTIPFGRQQLCYFAPESVESIRRIKGLKKHDDSTIAEDFQDFLDKGDYTFSYKMVFLLAFMALADEYGTCRLDELTVKYASFYRHRLESGLPVDRENCPYTMEFLQDRAKVQRSILSNPFEKFERKRFMFHVKADRKTTKDHPELRDLNTISFSHVLWEHIAAKERLTEITSQMQRDLESYYADMGGLTTFSFTADYAQQEPEASTRDLFAADSVSS